MYNMSGFPGTGAPKTGGLDKYFFMLSKALWHASSNMNGTLCKVGDEASDEG